MPWIGAKEYAALVDRARELSEAAVDLDPDGSEEAVPDQYLDRIERLTRANAGVQDWLTAYDHDMQGELTPQEQAAKLGQSMTQFGQAMARLNHAFAQGQEAYKAERVRLLMETMTDTPPTEDEVAQLSGTPEDEPDDRRDRVIGALTTETNQLREQLAEAREDVSRLTQGQSLAYTERARLVAVLASVWASWWDEDPAQRGWRVVYVESPTGQLSWHIHQDDWHLFEHVCRTGSGSGLRSWDQHTTDQKNQRMTALCQRGDWPQRAVRYPLMVGCQRLPELFTCDEGGWFVIGRTANGYELRRAEDTAEGVNDFTSFWIDRGQTVVEIRLTRWQTKPDAAPSRG